MKNLGTVFSKVWFRIRRNPVINAIAGIIAVQFMQDYIQNRIDWAHFLGYLSALFFGVIARYFTVPAKEVPDVAVLKEVKRLDD